MFKGDTKQVQEERLERIDELLDYCDTAIANKHIPLDLRAMLILEQLLKALPAMRDFMVAETDWQEPK